MKNSKTLGLLVGTTCLATIAMTQVSRPGETPAQDRKPAVAGQNNTAGQNNNDSLMMVQQRFQQAVTTELRSGAMKHDCKIDEGSVMISLLGEHGIVAGAPAKAGSGSALDAQRKPGDTSTTTGTGREQDKARDGVGTKTQNDGNMNQEVIGVVLFSRALAPSGAGKAPGAAGNTPGAVGGQDSQNREREAAGQGAIATDAAGSNELVAYEVRRSQQGQQVELVDQSGRVAMQVQLLGGSNNAAGRTREASAPREDREDATVGGGDPLGDPRNQNPQGKDRQRTGNTPQSDMDQANAGSSDWSMVYASVVHELCQKHHGKK